MFLNVNIIFFVNDFSSNIILGEYVILRYMLGVYINSMTSHFWLLIESTCGSYFRTGVADVEVHSHSGPTAKSNRKNYFTKLYGHVVNRRHTLFVTRLAHKM